jgi:endonuclease G, mitochondrial
MNDVRMRIPIEVIVKVGGVENDASVVITNGASRAAAGGASNERFNLDHDYDKRRGYDAKFLGRGFDVPLPTLTKPAMALVSRDPDAGDEKKSHLLHYRNFTVIMNRSRRLPFFAAANTTREDKLVGKKSRVALNGGAKDKWILDPRIPANHQVTTNEFYKPEIYDRGHLVRREDAYWGKTPREAEYANFDSFHYTNCTPQHPGYNQSGEGGIWGELENHIAGQAADKIMRLGLFAGPVLAKGDPLFGDIALKVPRRFWKIVLGKRKGPGNRLGAWGFLLSQSALVKKARNESVAEFEPRAFKVYQVPLARIVALTDVVFAKVVMDADVTKGAKNEAAAASSSLVIRSVADILS